jgi:hypothetical protein
MGTAQYPGRRRRQTPAPIVGRLSVCIESIAPESTARINFASSVRLKIDTD